MVAATVVLVAIVAAIAVAVIAILGIAIAILVPRMMVAVATAIACFTVDVALKASEVALDLIRLLTIEPAIRGSAEAVLNNIDVTIEAREFAPRQLAALAKTVAPCRRR